MGWPQPSIRSDSKLSGKCYRKVDIDVWPDEFGYIRFEDNNIIITRYVDDLIHGEVAVESDVLTSLLKSDIEGLLIGDRKLFYHNVTNRTSPLRSTNVEITLEYQQ